MTFYLRLFMNVGNIVSWHVGGVDSIAFEVYEDELGLNLDHSQAREVVSQPPLGLLARGGERRFALKNPPSPIEAA
jgi:hypothetical protein